MLDGGDADWGEGAGLVRLDGTDDDTLIGGGGAGTFVFGLNSGNDRTQDFSQEDDTIDLTALDLSADELAGVLAGAEKTSDGVRLDFTGYDGGTITFEYGTSEAPLADDFLIRPPGAVVGAPLLVLALAFVLAMLGLRLG